LPAAFGVVLRGLGGVARCERLEVNLHLDSPTVTSSQFLWKELPQRYVIEFNQHVSGVAAEDFEVVNLDTDQPEPVVYEGYDALTHKATLLFTGHWEGMLASGNYQLRIRPGAVSSAATGEPMATAHEQEFFFLWGDADHNRVVDATDYAILDNSYVNQAKTFPELSYYENGDFDYSTTWNSTDYSLIDAGYMIHLVEPTDFYAIAQSTSAMRVSWANDNPQVHQWRVERNSYDGNGYVPISGWLDSTTTFYDDSNLADGTWYSYRVRGRDTSGNFVAYTPHRGDYTVLAAAGDVQAEELAPSTARVSWTDNSASEDGFYVLMSSDGGQTWSTVATLGANQSSYDAAVTGQMSELFRVQAFGGDPTAPLLKAGMGPSTRISLKVPAIMEPASANPNPVTGTMGSLSVLGSTARGESYLTYTWSVTSKPADAPEPIFSTNGSNAAKNTSVTFFMYGAYRFTATIANEYTTITSSVDVTVIQTLTSISVSPGFAVLANSGPQQFTAKAYDQFGDELSIQPSFLWMKSGNGTFSNGLYTAPATGTPSAIVRASAGGKSGTGLVIPQQAKADFDDLAVGTVVTNQYPGIVFSAPAGKSNKVQPGGYGGTGHAMGTEPINPPPQNWNIPFYADFAVPARDVRFVALADDDSGPIAQVNVYANGGFAGTYSVVGDGNPNTPAVANLSAYDGVTRIEVSITDSYGLWWDDFTFDVLPPHLDLDSNNDGTINSPDDSIERTMPPCPASSLR